MGSFEKFYDDYLFGLVPYDITIYTPLIPVRTFQDTLESAKEAFNITSTQQKFNVEQLKLSYQRYGKRVKKANDIVNSFNEHRDQLRREEEKEFQQKRKNEMFRLIHDGRFTDRAFDSDKIRTENQFFNLKAINKLAQTFTPDEIEEG
jgi:leucyl aminopeptidase